MHKNGLKLSGPRLEGILTTPYRVRHLIVKLQFFDD